MILTIRMFAVVTVLSLVLTASAAPGNELPGLDEVIAALKKNERSVTGFRVQAEAKVRQRPGLDPQAAEIHREIRIKFAVDERARIRSEKEGGTPGRIGSGEVLQEKVIGTFDGKVARTLRGRDRFAEASISADWTRIYREVDPRDYLHRHFNQPLSKRFAEGKFEVVGTEEFQGRTLLAIESKPIERDGTSYKSRYLLDPQRDFFAIVRSASIRYPKCAWHEYTRIECRELQQEGGEWLPVHSVNTSFHVAREDAAKGGPFPIAWQFDVRFHDWERNPTFADSEFTLKFPAGVYVQDDLTGKRYRADEE